MENIKELVKKIDIKEIKYEKPVIEKIEMDDSDVLLSSGLRLGSKHYDESLGLHFKDKTN